MARPAIELTPDKHHVIVRGMKMGLSQESIAGLVRCSERTLRTWIGHGKRAVAKLENGEDITLEEEKFAALILDGAHEKGTLEQGLVATLLHHALKKKNPTFALAVLERLFPNWRMKAQLEIGEIGDATPEKAAELVRQKFGEHGAMTIAQNENVNETDDGGAQQD